MVDVCICVSHSLFEKQRLDLFGHVARLSHTVPANQVLRICTKARDGERPSQDWELACGRPPTTWIHQICGDTDDRNGGTLWLKSSHQDDDDDVFVSCLCTIRSEYFPDSEGFGETR